MVYHNNIWISHWTILDKALFRIVQWLYLSLLENL